MESATLTPNQKAAETKKRRLTKKEKNFAKEYLELGNGTQAALKTYDTANENVAAAIASENLRKQKIIDYLSSKAERAAIRVEELAENAENETVKLNANKDILDRAGFKPKEDSTPQTQNIQINIFSKEMKQATENFEQQIKKQLGYAESD